MRDYVGDALKTKQEGESVEDLLLRALAELTDDERSTRMSGHAAGLRGEMEPEPMAEEMAPEGEEALPPECLAGECDHPEHQLESNLPEGFWAVAEHDTDALVARIIQDAKVPRGSQYRDAGVLLRMADDAMRTIITPELLKAGEGHLATTQAVALVAGQSRVRLPARCVRLLGLTLLGSAGHPQWSFARATPEQEQEARAYGYNRKAGAPRLWFLEGSTVVLSPAVDSAGTYTLALRYARRPSRLVAPSACGTVINVLTVGSLSTLTYAPDSVLDAPTSLDIVKGSPGFESLGDGVEVTSTGTDTLTLDATLGAQVEVGDYLCPPGTSPVPQIPLDYHSVLSQAVVVQVLKEMGAQENMLAAKGTLDALLMSAQPTIDARSTEPEVCVQEDWL